MTIAELKYYDSLPVEKSTGYREIFDIFDAEQSGSLYVDQLQDVLLNLGQTTNDKQIKRQIKEIDDNNNGSIDFNEFVLLMVKQENPDKSKAKHTN